MLGKSANEEKEVCDMLAHTASLCMPDGKQELERRRMYGKVGSDGSISHMFGVALSVTESRKISVSV